MNLRVEPGERVMLLGPSGSGKSTLLAALAGLLTPDAGGEQEGAVLLDGTPARNARARAGLVMQDPEAALVMARAGDDVAFGLENRGVPAEEIWRRVDEALDAVGFPYGRDALTARLSGGEQQRLALAGILALRPGLLLLDEVTANLDPAGVALVRAVLERVLGESGPTTVMVEHRVEHVAHLCSRAVVLSGSGQVVADGPTAEVFRRQGAELAAMGVWVPGRRPVLRRPVLRRPVLRRPAPTAGPPLLSADQVTVQYPDQPAPALRPTDVTVAGAQTLAVTGPNGAGKSTLALCLAGLLRPTGGRVRAEPALSPPSPEPWRWRGRDLVPRIGTVFQDPEHQFVTSSVRRELLVGPLQAGASPAGARARADELLALLGLDRLAEANPFTLSGGQKRRLSVATAIASRPRLLVTDEPTFGQDALTWQSLVELLADLRDDGCGVVTVTHDEYLVAALADVRLELPAPERPAAHQASGTP